MGEHVVFAGEQSDVRPWIAALDAGVLCSTAVETFSLAALEVLASGVPMIMSDIGGASEIVEDGVNGYLFEAGNTEALLQRMRNIADAETRLRMRRAAQPSVERYTLERMVEAYERLALELAAEGSGRSVGRIEGSHAG
jgi:glycosyltransferase involved in cell wall biosynthesis